jgi:hypothetical protein
MASFMSGLRAAALCYERQVSLFAAYSLPPLVCAGFAVPGAVRAALAARTGTGIAVYDWCMVTMTASAGFLPEHW